MRTVLKSNLFKFVTFVVGGVIISSIASLLLTRVSSFRINDVLFVIGVVTTILSIFSMLDGAPIGWGAYSSSQMESHYISNEVVKLRSMDKEKLLTSIFLGDSVSTKLSSSEFLTIGIIILLISYII